MLTLQELYRLSKEGWEQAWLNGKTDWYPDSIPLPNCVTRLRQGCPSSPLPEKAQERIQALMAEGQPYVLHVAPGVHAYRIGLVHAYLSEAQRHINTLSADASAAYRQGRDAAIRGFCITPPSNIRSKADKADYEAGHLDGQKAAKALLSGMEILQQGGRTAHPVVAGYGAWQYRAVWRDEQAGRDYENRADALTGMMEREKALQAIDEKQGDG